ncbi:MAG TPA: DUF1707 domain-containing protein [Actinomycetes bacterium]|jgi:hypothetical protein|nr:DUF1707 domain-containing protein [Actinomycetes bacterium]
MDLEPDQRRAVLRASDADREQIVSVLRQHHAEGRLTVEEFTERMQRAFSARTFGELDPLTRDLPPLPPPLPEMRRPSPSAVAKQRFYHHLLSYAWVNAVLVGVWAIVSIASGHLLFFWPSWTLLGWGLALGSHAVRAFGPQERGPEEREERWSRPRLERRHRSRSHVYHHR